MFVIFNKEHNSYVITIQYMLQNQGTRGKIKLKLIFNLTTHLIKITWKYYENKNAVCKVKTGLGNQN
jgi:hypothetical protein